MVARLARAALAVLGISSIESFPVKSTPHISFSTCNVAAASAEPPPTPPAIGSTLCNTIETPSPVRSHASRNASAAASALPSASLLSATLIASANDACHVLADALAGSEAQFVLQMNARASKLGFTHFHAMNACGHDAPGHVATARELAALALTVMQQPRYVELSSLTQKTIHTVGRHPREFKLVNSNALIGRYPGAAGVKTGSTPEAGLCLAAFVLRESHWVLLVLLDAPDRWWTAVAMLDHAFAHAAP